ncbi:hypothetical protein VPHK435_0010 [Vibrio phage K435]
MKISDEMKSIQGVKVSDVFDLTKVSFPSSYTDNQVRVAGRAIANYDRMVEEISELKEFATMVANGMNEDPEAAVVHLRIHSREAKKLIAKLNQEGEE